MSGIVCRISEYVLEAMKGAPLERDKNQSVQSALEAWIETYGKDGEVYQVWECRSPKFRAEATIKAVKEDA